MKLNKGIKLFLVCIICIGLVTAVVLLIEYYNQ